MSERGRHGRRADRHSDLGPSSKDWQPGSAGRDESFTPDKDLWTAAHKGNLGAGRPGEDVHPGGVSGAHSGAASHDNDIQPGTQTAGRSWQSRRPHPDDAEAKLDQALQDTFPTSDPPSPALSGITGWDVGNSERNRFPRQRAPNAYGGYLRTGSPGLLWGVTALALLPVVASAVYYLGQSRQNRRFSQRRQSTPRQDE